MSEVRQLGRVTIERDQDVSIVYIIYYMGRSICRCMQTEIQFSLSEDTQVSGVIDHRNQTRGSSDCPRRQDLPGVCDTCETSSQQTP